MSRFVSACAFGAIAGAFLFSPAPAESQSNICNSGQLTCTLETRTNGGVSHACNDGVDNDGNGYIDLDDPHCQSEVLCQDGLDNDADGVLDGADSDCLCLRQASNLPNAPCTAGDISIAYTAAPVVSDGCINSSDDTIVATLTAAVTAHTPQRYDIGMWLLLSGGSALDGTLCTRQILQEVATVGGTPDRASGTGPYLNLDADRCGDELNGNTSTYIFPFTATLQCSDNFIPSGGQGGFIDIGQCGSWDNNSNTVCSNPTTALPGTGSKCRCERADTPIPGPNVRTVCGAFNTPSGLGANNSLDPGETAAFSLAFSNTVASCTPGSPVAPDTFGRNRCGTASFVRFAIDYTGNANTRGYFTYASGTTCADGVGGVDSGADCIPACTSTVEYPLVPGALCNDYANNRLIWAPRDQNPINAYGVVSPFSGSPLSLPFSYTLVSAATGPSINFDARIYWDDVLDTNANGSISATEAVDLTGAIAQTCTDCGCGTTLATTPVTLASFEAREDGRGVRFDWTTESEVGNVGFDLYALVEGERVRLNPAPIPATGSGSLAPQSYSATFPVPAKAESFELVDIDLKGERKSHGPFAADKRYGRPADTLPVDWPSIRREHGVAAHGAGPGRIRDSGRRALVEAAGAAAPVAIDLLVDRDGIYRVTYEALLAAGFDLKNVAANQLGLSSGATPVPIYVGANAKFGPGSYFEFLGQAVDTIYTKSNVYRLSTAVPGAARVRSSQERPSGAALSSYSETRRFGQDRAYEISVPGEDPFYDTRMLAWGGPGSWSYGFTVDGIAGSVPAALHVRLLGGATFYDANPDHRVEVSINGVPVGVATFDGLSVHEFEGQLGSGVLTEGANTMTLRMPGVPGTLFDLVYLDEFSVSYPRLFRAVNGRLDFAAAAGRFEVGDLPTANLVAYRLDATGMTRLERATAVADGGTFRAIVPGSGGAAKYAVASAERLLSPAEMRAARPSVDITSGSASYLVLSHSSFLGGLDALVAARRAQGHTVRVVDVEDVYAQFAGGRFGAEAIRDYVAYAHQNMGTRFVLLVGGDSYDYLGRLGSGAVSFLPTLYVQTSETVLHAPSDSAYADVDRDGVPDLAIGRFPVRTTAELANVVAKTLQYEANGYAATALLTADHSDPRANEQFGLATNRLADRLPTSWAVDKVYLDEWTLADARTALFWGLRQGTGLTTYMGHSGFSSWGSPMRPVSQRLFSLADIAALDNGGRPSVVAQFGCWNTYYVSPSSDSLGTRFVLADDRGAAAILGGATLVDDAEATEFGVYLMERLGAGGQTLGEAMLLAKRELASKSAVYRDISDVLYGWALLGDPGLRMAP